MSYYDDSSLFFSPNGYKASVLFAQKPMDANGQLTFTRASSATRVQSDGLIEKVRTNLVLQSQTFQTTWGPVNASVSADATTAPDSTLSADKLVAAVAGGISDQHRIDQTPTTAAGNNTFSVYAKKGELEFIFLRIGLVGAYFNLNNGASSSISAGIIATSVDAGNGWYRLIITKAAATANEVLRINLATSSGVNNFIGNGTDGAFIWGAQYELNDIATGYIPTTTAAVSVGPVSGLPRLDYLNSTCPRLLLEPQRTNLFTFSEQFDNAVWSKTSVSISANTTTSPDGTANADKLISNAVSGFHSLSFSVGSKLASTAYSFSFYAKAGEIGYCLPNFNSSFSGTQLAALVNLTTGAVTDVSAGLTATTQNVGNGWYRVVLTATSAANTSAFIATINTTNAAGSLNFTGDGTSGVFIYGAQLESSASYATSYIPTLGASVTRVADVASKTGISSLLGGTQGTWFLEMKYQPISSSTVSTMFVTGTSTIGLASSGVNTLRVRINAVNDIIGSVNPTIRHKIAISFDATGVVCFFNGNQITLPNGASQVVSGLDSLSLETGTRHNEVDIYQMLYFPTRLTNAQLSQLTTL